jgi:uncharacterized membrane protein
MSLSRPLLVGLIVSAALNVFLIGGVAGAVYVRLAERPVAPPVQPVPPMTTSVAPPTAAPTAPPVPVQRPAAAVRQPPEDRPARAPLWRAGDQLSPESRKALRQALRGANQKNQPITRQARAERQAALEALRAPGFDPAEVGRRLASARSLDSQARANVEAALAVYAATLSPAERAVLAQGLSKVYAPRRNLAGRQAEN